MARRRIVLLAVIAVVVGVPLVALSVTGVAVWQAAHTDDASRIDRTDAIVVLGAAQYQGRPSPVFAGRLEHAALLYREGRADNVIVVGAKRPGDQTTEAESGASYLVGQGVPWDAVYAVPEGATTLESLRGAAAFMHRSDMDSAFLVSDPWHNLRIKRMASDLGIEGYASATWHSAATSQETRLPGYVREMLAYLYYRLLGR